MKFSTVALLASAAAAYTPTDISQEAIEYIKAYNGFKPKPVKNAAGRISVGYNVEVDAAGPSVSGQVGLALRELAVLVKGDVAKVEEAFSAKNPAAFKKIQKLSPARRGAFRIMALHSKVDATVEKVINLLADGKFKESGALAVTITGIDNRLARVYQLMVEKDTWSIPSVMSLDDIEKVTYHLKDAVAPPVCSSVVDAKNLLGCFRDANAGITEAEASELVARYTNRFAWESFVKGTAGNKYFSTLNAARQAALTMFAESVGYYDYIAKYHFELMDLLSGSLFEKAGKKMNSGPWSNKNKKDAKAFQQIMTTGVFTTAAFTEEEEASEAFAEELVEEARF